MAQLWRQVVDRVYIPGIRNCMFSCSSFSCSLRKQTAAPDSRMDAIRLDATPAQATMYDQSYETRVLSRSTCEYSNVKHEYIWQTYPNSNSPNSTAGRTPRRPPSLSRRIQLCATVPSRRPPTDR